MESLLLDLNQLQITTFMEYDNFSSYTAALLVSTRAQASAARVDITTLFNSDQFNDVTPLITTICRIVITGV